MYFICYEIQISIPVTGLKSEGVGEAKIIKSKYPCLWVTIELRHLLIRFSLSFFLFFNIITFCFVLPFAKFSLNMPRFVGALYKLAKKTVFVPFHYNFSSSVNCNYIRDFSNRQFCRLYEVYP